MSLPVPGGAALGCREPVPGRLLELPLQRGGSELHAQELPPAALRLQPLEQLGTLQCHLRRGHKGALQVTPWEHGDSATRGGHTCVGESQATPRGQGT